MNAFGQASLVQSGAASDLAISGLIQVLIWRDELTCPRCSSANVNLKFRYMGELECRHCHYFWRSQ